MRMLGATALAVSAWLVSTASNAQTGSELSAGDITQIKAATQAMVKATLAKDWPAWAALFTPDGVALPPNGPALKGRTAIQAWAAQVPPVTEFTLTPTEVRGQGNLAYVVGTYSVANLLPGAPQPVKDVGKFIEVRRRQQGGKWLIEASCWNSDSPLPTAPR